MEKLEPNVQKVASELGKVSFQVEVHKGVFIDCGDDLKKANMVGALFRYEENPKRFKPCVIPLEDVQEEYDKAKEVTVQLVGEGIPQMALFSKKKDIALKGIRNEVKLLGDYAIIFMASNGKDYGCLLELDDSKESPGQIKRIK